MRRLRALLKYLLSFLKADWDFDDYPLEKWSNVGVEDKKLRHGARFTNWFLLVAHGKTEAEAIESLRQAFIEYRQNNTEVPRPGSVVPIKFYETDRIDQFEEIAVDFFDKIIGINYYDCFVSDMSSLWEFDVDEEKVNESIQAEYDIIPKQDLLVEIFEQISEKRQSKKDNI